ncbi:MAG: hypothetical protein ACKVPX_14880 [Myxococcaceae bacterium]
MNDILRRAGAFNQQPPNVATESGGVRGRSRANPPARLYGELRANMAYVRQALPVLAQALHRVYRQPDMFSVISGEYPPVVAEGADVLEGVAQMIERERGVPARLIFEQMKDPDAQRAMAWQCHNAAELQNRNRSPNERVVGLATFEQGGKLVAGGFMQPALLVRRELGEAIARALFPEELLNPARLAPQDQAAARALLAEAKSLRPGAVSLAGRFVHARVLSGAPVFPVMFVTTKAGMNIAGLLEGVPDEIKPPLKAVPSSLQAMALSALRQQAKPTAPFEALGIPDGADEAIVQLVGALNVALPLAGAWKCPEQRDFKIGRDSVEPLRLTRRFAKTVRAAAAHLRAPALPFDDASGFDPAPTEPPRATPLRFTPGRRAGNRSKGLA